MKKIIPFILALFVTSTAQAQSTAVEINKKIVCDSTKKIMDSLLNEYKELPGWVGTDENTKYSLMINHETGSWTLIQFDKGTTCIIGVGENSRAINFGKSKLML